MAPSVNLLQNHQDAAGATSLTSSPGFQSLGSARNTNNIVVVLVLVVGIGFFSTTSTMTRTFP